MAGESPRRGFYVAKPGGIRSGQPSDIYFFRTLDVLKKAGKDRVRVLMETTAQALPNGWPWAVFAGLEETVNLLRGRKVDLWALPEGTVFPPMTPRGIPVPVLYIEGPYGEFCIYETPVLGFLCEASGIATKSARVRVAAGERGAISLGGRRGPPPRGAGGGPGGARQRAAAAGGRDAGEGADGHDAPRPHDRDGRAAGGVRG